MPFRLRCLFVESRPGKANFIGFFAKNAVLLLLVFSLEFVMSVSIWIARNEIADRKVALSCGVRGVVAINLSAQRH